MTIVPVEATIAGICRDFAHESLPIRRGGLARDVRRAMERKVYAMTKAHRAAHRGFNGDGFW